MPMLARAAQVRRKTCLSPTTLSITMALQVVEHSISTDSPPSAASTAPIGGWRPVAERIGPRRLFADERPQPGPISDEVLGSPLDNEARPTKDSTVWKRVRE